MSYRTAWMNAQGPYYVMVFVQFVYAGMALFSKAAISGGMDPFVFVVYRQGLASIFLLPFICFVERSKAPSLSFGLLCKIFFTSFFGLTISLNFFYIGIKYTTATLATACNNTIPVITFIMAVLLRMEKVNYNKVFGMAKLFGSLICLSGALLLALYKGPPLTTSYHSSSPHLSSPPTTHQSHSHNEWVKGILLVILSNSTWSFWLILQGKIVQQYPAKGHLIVLQCFFSCIQTAPLAAIIDRSPSSWKLRWDANLLAVVYCGVAVSGITYWLQVWCIKKRGAVFTAVFTPFALIITAVFSAFIWKEILHWGSIGGSLLLVCGLYCVLWGKSKEVGCNKTQVQKESNETVLDANDETV